MFCWVLDVCGARLTPAISLNTHWDFARWIFLIQSQTAWGANLGYDTFRIQAQVLLSRLL